MEVEHKTLLDLVKTDSYALLDRIRVRIAQDDPRSATRSIMLLLKLIVGAYSESYAEVTFRDIGVREQIELAEALADLIQKDIAL